MVGQGSPRTSRYISPYRASATACNRCGKFAALAAWIYFLSSMCLCIGFCSRAAADDSLRARIAWGGSEGKTWEGSISISAGSLTNPRPLGIEADEPGSMWLEDGRLSIRQKTPRLYDGLDIDVTPASDAAVLRIELRAADQSRPVQVEIPVADLKNMVGERAFNFALDERGTRLLARRAPGDTLKLEFARKSLVFSPGENFRFSVSPHHIPDLKGRRLRIKVDVFADRGAKQISSLSADTEPADGEAATMSLDLPGDEGVYDLVVSAEQIPSVRLPRGGSLPVGLKQTVAQRKLQLVVVDAKNRLRADEQPEPAVVAEIDPVNPKWLDRLAKSAEDISLFNKLPALQVFRKGPLGSGNLAATKHPLGDLVALSPGSPGRESWEAYTLPVRNVGTPHVLEVEYPSDVAQTMGISVLEPDSAGSMLPIQLDSGVDVAEDLLRGESEKPRMLRHRLIFWPRGNTPIVLITNRRYDAPAVYGRIRVLAGWKHLPAAAAGANEQNRAADAGEKFATRMAAVYMDRPLFPESFSAGESYDAWSRRSLDDWHTFHEGASRMVEYMQHVGMGGLMISVLADGATIYPSRVLQPTPRYDKGVFFDSGQDPLQKDVLEMLLKMFDRERLKLIPALEFGSPLAELEEILRRGGDESAAIRWTGPEGQTWQDAYEPHRQRAPYYNVLNPQVQEAMLKVVRELLDNYAAHESFAGLAIQLSGHGYAQLPGPEWGMDDATVAEFQRDTGIKLAGEGEPATATEKPAGRERFTNRWKQLSGPHYNQWLRWRAARLAAFYQRMQAELAKARPRARLYLAGADAFESEEMQEVARPALPRKASMAEMLLRIGIDESHYHDPEGIVLLRPQRITPCQSHSADAANLEIEQMPDRDAYFAALPYSGNLFFHQPRELRLESFDRKSPFRSSFTLLSSQIVPSGERNRRRFAHGLAALDSQVMFEGGWLVPLGQEDSTRLLLAAYSRLPAVAFKRLAGSAQPGGTQPVTVRYATLGGSTYLYAVNDSPLAATLKVRVTSSAGTATAMEELSGRSNVPGLKEDERGAYWQPTLEPYDLIAVRFSGANVTPAEPEVTLVGDAEKILNDRIRDLGARANALRAPPLLQAIENSNFERTADAEGKIPGWISLVQNGATVGCERMQTDDSVQEPRGANCVRMKSDGPPAALVSAPFKPPATGRLKMFVWLCVPENATQPTLQWSLVGKLEGREFSRAAVVGRSTPNLIANRWGLYEFPINSLPLQGLGELRVRFDLTGPGEVLIDDVQLSHLEFEDQELRELGRLIQTADLHLRMHQVGDCIRLLEGYWPQFLEANVPLPAAAQPPAVAAKPRVAANPPREKSEEKESGWFGRMKNALPKKFW